MQVLLQQVLSGSLDWSPLHTSTQFWKDNVSAFEERDCQILRVLLKLLEASREVRCVLARHTLAPAICRPDAYQLS